MNGHLFPTVVSDRPRSRENSCAEDSGNGIDVHYSDWSIARMSDVDCIAHVLLLLLKAATCNGCIRMITYGRRAGVSKSDHLDLRRAVARLVFCGPLSLKAATASWNVFVG